MVLLRKALISGGCDPLQVLALWDLFALALETQQFVLKVHHAVCQLRDSSGGAANTIRVSNTWRVVLVLADISQRIFDSLSPQLTRLELRFFVLLGFSIYGV
jgi:hypothetical protein